jgi:hypothetical protein
MYEINPTKIAQTIHQEWLTLTLLSEPDRVARIAQIVEQNLTLPGTNLSLPLASSDFSDRVTRVMRPDDPNLRIVRPENPNPQLPQS